MRRKEDCAAYRLQGHRHPRELRRQRRGDACRRTRPCPAVRAHGRTPSPSLRYGHHNLQDDLRFGFGTPEAVGITSREFLQILRGLGGLNLIGADVVEVPPAFDHAQLTGVAAPTSPTTSSPYSHCGARPSTSARALRCRACASGRDLRCTGRAGQTRVPRARYSLDHSRLRSPPASHLERSRTPLHSGLCAPITTPTQHHVK
ncbi:MULTISPECIES: arginase family protein [unclassified Aeromicrobium]|uniref:arginase family protein n=1 Tax=unclassified Aeromicrobium TaxID=2633570 RepID=UPI00288A6C39|nr:MULTISPECIES: arginase family protein [unclassified Aeromicrobium]